MRLGRETRPRLLKALEYTFSLYFSGNKKLVKLLNKRMILSGSKNVTMDLQFLLQHVKSLDIVNYKKCNIHVLGMLNEERKKEKNRRNT